MRPHYKTKSKFLYHSSDIGNLKILSPQPLRVRNGFKKKEKGVWATKNIKLSRAFGISLKRFAIAKGGFSLDITNHKIILYGWKFSRIPKNFRGYTYYLNPNDFKKFDKWQYISHKPVRVLKVETYNLRQYILNNFRVFETILKQVQK